MAYGGKTQDLLAAVALLLVSSSCSDAESAHVTNISNDISSFSNIIYKNRIKYEEFPNKFSEFGNVSTAGKPEVNFISYGRIGKCRPVDNRLDVFPDNLKSHLVNNFECEIENNATSSLFDIGNDFGEVYHVRTPLHAAPLSDTLKVSPGNKLYVIGFDSAAVNGVFLQMVVESELDLVKLSKDSGNFPVISNGDILKYGKSIKIIRILFHIEP